MEDFDSNNYLFNTNLHFFFFFLKGGLMSDHVFRTTNSDSHTA